MREDGIHVEICARRDVPNCQKRQGNCRRDGEVETDETLQAFGASAVGVRRNVRRGIDDNKV